MMFNKILKFKFPNLQFVKCEDGSAHEVDGPLVFSKEQIEAWEQEYLKDLLVNEEYKNALMELIESNKGHPNDVRYILWSKIVTGKH